MNKAFIFLAENMSKSGYNPKPVVTHSTKVNETSLDDVVDENWTPAVKRGNRLVSIIDDAAMHSGQAIYARRLLGRED